MVKRGTKRKGRRKKDKKPEKRPKTTGKKVLVLAGSDSDSSSDSGHLFEEALQAKNAASSSKRALHKHIKTQLNKWIKMYGSAPSTQTFVDANLARYVASTFEIHPNPPQVKQMRLFMKHQALQLGLDNPMFTHHQARYPLLHQQMGGIRARPEFKSHTPVKAEVFDGYEYSFGLQWLFDQYHAAEYKAEAALNLAIWVLLTDVVNRPGTVKQVPALRFCAKYPRPRLGPRHFECVASFTKTAQNQDTAALRGSEMDKVRFCTLCSFYSQIFSFALC
jgi:hypothetical protein